MNYKLYLLYLLLVTTSSIHAINRTDLIRYAQELSGKKGADLKTAICKLSQPKKVLPYGSGAESTWGGFYSTDRLEDGQCIDRYSNDKRYFTNKGAVPGGMNIEHSFPKSWWGGTNNNAYKDLQSDAQRV